MHDSIVTSRRGLDDIIVLCYEDISAYYRIANQINEFDALQMEASTCILGLSNIRYITET